MGYLDKLKKVEIIPNEFKNKWFVFFFLSLISSSIILKYTKPAKFHIFFLLILMVSSFLFNIKVKKRIFIEKIQSWTLFLLILSLTIGYATILSLKTYQATMITFIFLLISFLLMIITPLILHLRNLWKSTSLTISIISYVIISFLFILLFALFFSLSEVPEKSGIFKFKDNEKIEGKIEHIYFSASVYYTNLFGDAVPQGYSKLVMIVELVISYIFHIYLLGIVISKLSDKYKS